MIHCLLTLTLCLAAAFGQQAPTLRSFCFRDYENVLEVDLKQLRDTGVWDDLGASALKLALGRFDDEMGFRLEDADRLMALVRVLPENEQRSGANHEDLFLFEGNKELPWPKQSRETHETQVGAGTMRAYSEHSSSVSLRVGKLALMGHRSAIEPVLQGKPHDGLPCADVMSLQADRRGLLTFVAFRLARDTPPQQTMRQALSGVEWPADDEPTFVSFRLRLAGDQLDPRLDLEMVLRHTKVGDGIAVTEPAIDAALAKLVALPEARMFAPLLKKVERTRSGADAIWRVDLGRSRDAAGTIGTMLGLLLVGMPVAVEAAAPAAAVPVPIPVPEGGK
jgi:hypothetical protein